VSSASALLKSLVTAGYLDYDRKRRVYLPTMRTALLGRWIEEAVFGEAQVVTAMEDLHRRTGEAVILAAQRDLEAVYVHLIHSDQPLQYRATPGLRRPIVRSGAGWALLAAMPDAEIEELRRRANAAAEAPVSREALMANVQQTRAQGYAFSHGAVSEGVGVIAMALPQPRLGKGYALAVGGYLHRLERNEAEIVAALRAAVAQLSGDGVS
jgi:DNA-binding IclR family transcriptional regulator